MKSLVSGSLLGLPRRLALNSSVVVIGTVVVTNLLRIASSVTLTRILTPEVFGTIGVIMSVAFIITMISDLGFQSFIIRHKDGGLSRFLDVIWTIRLIRSILLALLVLALSGPIAHALAKPGLQAPIAASSLFFLLEGLSSLALINAVRERRLLKLSLVEIIEAVAQLVLAILFSLLLRNIWGIILAMILSRGTRVLMSYSLFDQARRRPAFERRYFGELWGFARFVAGSSIITMFLAQSDKVVLSRIFPLETFGLYMVAVNIAAAPAAFSSAFSHRILYPIYAKTVREEPGQFADVLASAGKMPIMLYMVAAGAFPALAPSIIAILYDPRYIGAATFLQLLAIAPIFALGNAASSEALVALGKPQAVLFANLVRLAWLFLAGTIAFIETGPLGVAFAVGTMEAAALLYNSWEMYRRGLLPLRRDLAGLAAGGAGFAMGLLINEILLNFGLGT